VRLDSIREFVMEAIERLRKIPPQRLLGRSVSDAGSRCDMHAIGQAWRVCSDELRAEAGLPDPQHLRSARMDSIATRLARDPDWATDYHEALGKYRTAAAEDLGAWLDSLPPAGRG
jgi:hypothetical protein